MGSGSSRVSGKLIESSTADYEKFIGDGEGNKTKKIILKHNAQDHRNVTLFSSASCAFGGGNDKLTITTTGGGVTRLGLTRTDPREDQEYHKNAVFEQEDGFGDESSTWTMYMDRLGCLCYGKTGNEAEVLQLGGRQQLWIYIIVIFGQPSITATYRGSPVIWTVSEDSLIVLQDSGSRATLDSSMNRGLCMMTDPVQKGGVYNINWSMKLDEWKVAGKAPVHGYIRIGIVSGDLRPDSLDQNVLKNKNKDVHKGLVVWCTGSAVKNFPYSGVIAFSLRQQTDEIQHNLLVNSANDCRTKTLGFHCTGSERLVIELSSGHMTLQHRRGAREVVKQKPGSMIYFGRYGEKDQEVLLKNEITSYTKCRPMRIQYGSDPSSFVTFFNEKVAVTSIAPKLKCRVVEVHETDTVQVSDVPKELVEDDLLDFFTRQQSCGGGDVVRITQMEELPHIWIIKYQNKQNAQNVWMGERYQVRDATVRVLPYFSVLGHAVNHGLKPILDKTGLVIDDLDPDKVRYMMETRKAREQFEKVILHEARAKVVWPNNESDFEKIQDEDYSVRFECVAENHEFDKVAAWKEIVEKTTYKVFNDTICKRTMQIKYEVIDSTESWLDNHQSEFNYSYTYDNESSSAIVITSNENNMNKIEKELEHILPLGNKISRTLEENISQKYIALDSQGKLGTVESNNEHTRFTIDSEGKVTLRGPEHEVNRAINDILTLTSDLVEAIIEISPGEAKLLISEKGKIRFHEQLMKKRLHSHFWIDVIHLGMWFYSDDRVSVGERRIVMQECISDIIKTKNIPIPENTVHVVNDRKWYDFVYEREQEVDLIAICVIRGQGSDTDSVYVQMSGSESALKNTSAAIESFLKKNETCSETLQFSKDIVDYLADYVIDTENEVFDFKTEWIGDSEYYTGIIAISGCVEDVKKAKEELVTAAPQVKIFWLYLSKPWIAEAVSKWSLTDIEHDMRCCLQAETGDSLANYGIPCVALYPPSGAIIQIQLGDFKLQKVNVVVISDSTDSRPQESDTDNPSFNDAGRLHCQQTLNVICPRWIDGQSKEQSALKDTVTKLLLMVSEKKYTSVLLPTLGVVDGCGFPVDKATQCIMESVADYFTKNPSTHIKQVILCDRKNDVVDKFTEIVTNHLKQPWFQFKHGRPHTSWVDSDGGSAVGGFASSRSTSAASRPDSAASGRPKSGRPVSAKRTGQLEDGRQNLQHSLLWKQSGENRNPPYEEDDNMDVDEEETRTHKDAFADGLPYKIAISDSTNLIVSQGSIVDQQVDAIVSPSSDFSEPSNGPARAIMEKGGAVILQEYQQLRTLGLNEVKVTGSGNLECNSVFHVRISERWKESSGYDDVYSIMCACLNETKSRRCRSIAFPSIGTGLSRYPADQVADAMINATCDFIARDAYGSETSLQEIRIVLYYGDAFTCQTFQEEIPNIIKLQPSKMIDKGSKKGGKGKKKGVKIQKFSRSRTNVKYVARTSTYGHTLADDVVIFKVVSKRNQDDFKQDFETLVENEFTTATLDVQELTNEDALSPNEINHINRLEWKYNIKVEINKPKKDQVMLSGLKANVREAETEATRLLHGEFPKWRGRDRLYDMVAKNFQWYFEEGGVAKAVDAGSNFDLYMGYQGDVDFDYHNKKEDKKYRVIVATLEEHPVSDPTKKRKLFQRKKVNEDARIPDYWDIAKNTEDTALVELPMNEGEFDEVKKKFLNAGCPATNILKITRVEDRHKWLQYVTKRTQLEHTNPQSTKNERELWHGTTADTVQQIIANGYDRSFAGANATVHGKGAYFATTSRYSNGFALPDQSNNVCRMFLNKVLTGVYCASDKDMTCLPVRPDGKTLYDSSVNNTANPTIFVIFHDTQAYPTYLIEYNR